ncbi:MAG: hypothetical protein ACI4I1_08915 [Oscillospiraceae bacterium]
MKFKFTVDIDNINYAQMIRALLPYIDKSEIPLPSAVLDAAEAPGVLENFLRFVPQEQQDKLFLSLFEQNSGRITDAVVRFADKHGVEANISGLKLEEKL